MDFKFYLAVFWRRFPYFLILLSLGTIMGLVIALTQKPVYVAQARLIVESQQIPDDLAASTVRTDASEQLQIIQQRIFTRDNLLDIADRLSVYDDIDNTKKQLRPDEKVNDLNERINVDTYGGSMERGRSTAIVMTVSFDAPAPELAAAVSNEVVKLILQENVKMRTTVSGQTLDFFAQETKQIEQELSQIRSEILVFQEANLDALPDSLQFRRTLQAAAQERHLELEREQTQLRDRRDRMVELFEQTGEMGLVGVVERSAAEIQLQRLQDEFATASAVLAPDNPRVRVLAAQISALERSVTEQLAATSLAGTNEDGTLLTPFQLQLADIEGQMAFIEVQKDLITENLDALGRSIAATPGNALTLATLEQNYDNLRARYDRAVSNRAAAELGDTIESLSKGQRITVIEPAIAPATPTKPNRRRIAAMGAAAGLGMGLGLIVLLEFLNTAVRRPIDIVNGLQMTPIMTIPYLHTRAQIWRRRLIVFAILAAVLIGVPAALFYVNANIQPLQPIFDDVLRRMGLGQW